jgi:hypothetical protein
MPPEKSAPEDISVSSGALTTGEMWERVAALPQREAITPVWRYRDELAFDVIGQRYGMSRSDAWELHNRALRRLRLALRRCGRKAVNSGFRHKHVAPSGKGYAVRLRVRENSDVLVGQ